MPAMTAFNRRAFLRYVGYGVGAAAAAPWLPSLSSSAAMAAGAPAVGAWVLPDGAPCWEPLAYPVPLPGDAGDAAGDAARLARYEVRDALTLPAGFAMQVVAQWGDRLTTPGSGPGPGSEPIVFGFNCDYTGLTPIPGQPDHYWLLVNHEYISATPWLQGYAAATARPLPELRLVPLEGDDKGQLQIDGQPLGAFAVDLPVLAQRDAASAGKLRALARAALDDLGVSVLHVCRAADGSFAVVPDAPDHRRITGVRGVNIAAAQPTAATGPAAGLIGTPPGTFCNCSGATTPWGTFLTCEENFQDQVLEEVDPAGARPTFAALPLAGKGGPRELHLPFELEGLGEALDPPLDGRQFGWVCEVDPRDGALRKHTALGRFRHENVALRAEPGQRLAAYMGDDRRGGHIWKFVSLRSVEDPANPRNTELLHEGVLYVARFHGDYTGQWIPLTPATPLARPTPEHYPTGHQWLPLRPRGGAVAVGTLGAKRRQMSPGEWVATVEQFAGKPFEQCTLGDLVRLDPAEEQTLTPRQRWERQQAVLCVDAFLMANAIGGTPTARPEDLEIHPGDHSVYIAFTDSTGSGDGAPDQRVFPDSQGENTRQYGAVYRLAEQDHDPAATRFTWGRFIAAGEAAEGGGGFACADNLVFDPRGNLWMVCDISTVYHNFPVQRDRKAPPGSPRFVGVFGNNAMFMIPTVGPHAGQPRVFAIGPMECELTGPTFTADGRTLLLAVQHPGEMHGGRGLPGSPYPESETRPLRIAARDGALFTQQRTVPIGSNFPAAAPGVLPRPAVVCITRQS